MSVAAMATLRHFGSRAVPALPGATRTSIDARRLRELPGQRVFAAAAADDEDFHGAQCRKCRMPVKTIAMPRSSAAAMTSSSRIEPPGWITARDAELRGGVEAVAEREERVGGHHAARDRELCIGAFIAAMRVETTRLDLAGADADRPAVLREHDRVRLDELADPPGEEQVRELGRRRAARRVTSFSIGSSMVPSSRVCTSRPPATDLSSTAAASRVRADRSRARACSAFAPSAASASGANAGATITSTNWRSRMAAAVAASSGRLKAMMPPNADVGSAFVRSQVGLVAAVERDRRAAGIRVLHDHAGGRRELAHAFERGVGIRDVVVGELLALQLPRRARWMRPAASGSA